MIRFNCPTCGRHYELPNALAGLPLVCKQCGQRITPPAPSPDPPPPPRPVAPVKPPPAAPVAAPKPAPKPPPKSVEVSKPTPAPIVSPVKPPAKSFAELPGDDDILVSKPDSTPDIDFNIGGPTAASLSDAARTRPTGLSDASRRPPDLSGAVGPIDSIPDLDLDQLSRARPARPAPGALGEINFDLLPKAPPPPHKPPAPRPPEPVLEPKSESTLIPFLADLVVFAVLVVAGLFLGQFLVRKPMGQVFSESGSAAKFPPVDLLLLVGPPVMFGLIYLLLNSRERTLGAWLRRRKAAQS